MLLFAAFFSAVLLCLTSFARSFKEAQAYLIPLMLVSLAPGIMAMMPGLKLGGVLTVVPLVNIVLMARDLFDVGVDPVNGTIVVLTTLLYALAALSLAAKVFGAESVLYNEQSSWSDLLRRPEEPQKTASIPAMLWCLALMVPIQFAMIAVVRSLGALPAVVGIFLGVTINLLLFGLLPALFVYLGRVEIRSGLGLSLPKPTGLLGALLLGVSLWPFMLLLLQQSSVAKVLEERFGAVMQSFRDAQTSLGWGVLVIVIVPAILEEVYFRGLLFNALKARCNAIVTIAASGLLFGLTHVILDGALGSGTARAERGAGVDPQRRVLAIGQFVAELDPARLPQRDFACRRPVRPRCDGEYPGDLARRRCGRHDARRVAIVVRGSCRRIASVARCACFEGCAFSAS